MKRPYSKKEILSISKLSFMKIISATSEIPNMTGEEAEKFLESKLNLQAATIDEQGNPNIQPAWFFYDRYGEKL
jgi:hypothetical protein